MLLGLNIILSLMFLVLANKIKSNKKAKVYIVYDIEADGVDFDNKNEWDYYLPSNNEKIFSISYKGNDMNKAKCLIIGVDGIVDEKDLLTRFGEIAKDYKILIGHNNIRFDDVLLKDRMERLDVRSKKLYRMLDGSNRLDTIELAKLLNYGGLYGFSLKGLAKELNLPFSKKDINPVVAYRTKNFKDLKSYNNRDVELTERILLDSKALEMVYELQQITGCKPKHVTRSTKILASFIYNNPDEYPIQANPDLEGKNFGGFNYRKDNDKDRPVLYVRYNDLVHLDVSSMYPSLMILIGADTGKEYENFNIETGEIKPFGEIKEYGSVAKMVEFFVNKRREIKDKLKMATTEDIKDELDRKQKAMKILCNSVYGATDTDYFIMANPKLGSLITALGRDVLKACIKEFQAVFAKTDSVWIPNIYTVDEVNDFVSKYLKEKYNLDNKEGILRFELEREVKTLIPVDKGNYAEITPDGEYNLVGKKFNPFKKQLSQFEYDVAIKYAVKGESIDSIDDFIDSKLHEPLSYFSQMSKLSKKQLHHANNNIAWLEANDYYYVTDFDYNKVFTEHGYVVYDHIEPNIPISKEYATYLAYNHLYNLGLTNNKPKDTYKQPFIPLIPTIPLLQKKDGKYRFAPNKSLIAKHLDIKDTDKFHGWEFYSKFNLSNIESKYQGLLCTRNTGYFFLDIDKDVDKWIDVLKTEFPIHERHWTRTRSGKAHIVFKTTDENIFNLKLNTDDVELKTNELVPLYDNGEYGDYSSFENTIPLEDMKNIGYSNFVKKLQKVGLLGEQIELKETVTTLDSYNIVELDNPLLEKVVEWVKEAIRLYDENKELLSSNTYFMAIGNQLKQYLTEDDILTVLESISYDHDLTAKTRSTALNKKNYKTGLHKAVKYDDDDMKESYDAIYYPLKSHNNSLKSIINTQYRTIFGEDPFNIVEVLKTELLDYTNKYEELAYGITNILGMKLYKLYRTILLSDKQETGKSFYLNLLDDLTPDDLISLEDYVQMTESTFRQICKIIRDVLNGKVIMFKDTSKAGIEHVLNILSTIKTVMTGDNKDGVYRIGKSKLGGAGIQEDLIYSKDGLLLFIANPEGFNLGAGGEERRTSNLSLRPENPETRRLRLSDDLKAEFQKVDIDKRKERIKLYINSIVKAENLPDVPVNSEYYDKLNEYVKFDPTYYIYLLKAFCILENRTEITDDVFDRFLQVMQLTKYSELDSPHRTLLEFLISYYIPVEDNYFDGLTTETIRKKHKYKRKQKHNRTFTKSEVQLSLPDKTVKPESELLQGLANKGYLLRACKNQKGNWIYALNKTKLIEVGLL